MINYIEKYHSHLYYILGFLCFFLCFFQRIPGLTLKIGNAYPLLLLPAVMVVAALLREWTGFVTGLICGIALDTFQSGSACFNTLAFIVIGAGFGLVFRFLLNRNIKSMILAGLVGSFLFFVIRWFFLTLLAGDESAIKILFKYEIPSAIYTALFVIPFFIGFKKLCKKYLVQQS